MMVFRTIQMHFLLFFSNIISEHGTTMAMLQIDCIAAPYCFIEDGNVPIMSYYDGALIESFNVDDAFINGLNLPAGVGFEDITITDIEFSIKGTHGQQNDLMFTVRQTGTGNIERLNAQQVSDNNAVDFDFVLTNNPGANTFTPDSDVNCGGCSYYENNNIGTNLIDFMEGNSPLSGEYRIVIQDGDDNAPLQDILGTLQQFCIHTYCYEYVIPTDNPTTNPTANPTISDIITENYCVVGKRLTWSDAQQFCQDEYGTGLAIVDSQAKNDELQSIGTPMWLGGSDMEVENTWYWMGNNISTLFYVTGVGTEEGLYSNWGTNRPNSNGNEDCLAINVATEQETEGSGVWDDVNCNDNSNFIVACNCPATPAPTGITPSPTDNPAENECCLLQNGYSITPLDGSSTGGDVIRIDTECLDETDEVECNFDGTTTNAFFVDGVAYCPLPPAGPCIQGNVKGTTDVYLVVNGQEYPELQTQYTYIGLNTFDDYGISMTNSWFIIEGDQTRTLTWDTSLFASNTLRLIGYAYQLGTDNNSIFLDTTTSNDGNEIVNIPNNLLLNGNNWLYNIKFLLIDTTNSHFEETNCMCVNDGLVEDAMLTRCSCTVCTQKSKVATVWGDPHYIVVDAQQQFTYQGFGIYRLLYVGDIGFEVQSQNNWCGGVYTLDVGCTIGMAIRQPGYPDISLVINSFSFQSMRVLVTTNGVTVERSNLGFIDIENYVYGILTPTRAKFWFSNGFKVQYSLVSLGHIHIWYPYHWLWKANGMLGRFNGVAGDDLFPYALAQIGVGTLMYNLGQRYQVIPCPTVIAPYLQRCQNRRRLQTIDPSLIFDTNALNVNQTDPVIDFDLNNFDPILVAEAQAFCNDEHSCIYDYLLAGPEFASGTLLALDSIREELAQILIVDPFFCVFTCLNGGVCSGQGQCTCIPPYTGSRCQDVDPVLSENPSTTPTSDTANPTVMPSNRPTISPTQNPITESYDCIEEKYSCLLNCQSEAEARNHPNAACSKGTRDCITECNEDFDDCYDDICDKKDSESGKDSQTGKGGMH